MTESDKKAVEEFRREYKKSWYCCVECLLKWVELFIRKTRQEAREEGDNYADGFSDAKSIGAINERHRILNLPCMQEEESDGSRSVPVRNELRREIRDALNKK